MWNKIAANYGSQALKVLGLGGYARYLAASIGALPRIVAQRNLRPVDIAMHGVLDLRHPVTGANVRVDLDAYRPGDIEEGTYTFGLVREIWLRNVYLRPFALPEVVDCVIDLGANRGIFALQACRFARHVIAVEALEKYREPLLRNLAGNQLDNLRLVHAFVGGDAFLASAGSAVIGLADLMAMASGHAIDFMKIDIEGSEFGLDLAPLSQAKRLAMEVHPQWGSSAGLVAAVRALGFECRLFDESMRPVPAPQAAFVYAINTRFSEAVWSC